MSPALFREEGTTGFLRNFFAGLLTTAGLSNIGGPSGDGELRFGLHGRISNIAAEDIGVSQQRKGDEYEIRLGQAQDRDAEDERRLGDPKWRNRPQSYPRRGDRSR